MKSPLGSQPLFQSSTCVGAANVPLNDRYGLGAMLFRGLEYCGGGIVIARKTFIGRDAVQRNGTNRIPKSSVSC
jgi:hypothetical protein